MTIQGIDCKIIEKRGKKALIEIDGPDGEKQKISIPSENIPQKALPGQSLKIFVLENNEALISQKKLAKAILEEILNGK